MPDRPNWYHIHPPYCTCADCGFAIPRSRNLFQAALREIRLRGQQPVIGHKFFKSVVDKVRRLGK